MIARSIYSFTERIVPIFNLYEFLFNIAPYVNISDSDNILLFSNEASEIREFIDTIWSLNLKSIIYTCSNENLKGKGGVEVIKFDEPLCEVRMGLSLLKSILLNQKNKRAERILSEISDFTDLEQWIKTKVNNLRGITQLILSPNFLPSKFILSDLGIKALEFNEIPVETEVYVVYSGGEMVLARRIEFNLLKLGKKINEILIDVDPILAPLYLILIFIYIKIVG
jgi:hypothetical protein